MNTPSLNLSRKLEKLIPMLSSDKDGEVLAAVRAISLALASNGFDWHDLAATLSTALAERQSLSSTIAPPASFDLMSHQERRAWCDALMGVDFMTHYERSRVADIANTVRAGMDYAFKPKTLRLIDALIARAEAMGVRA